MLIFELKREPANFSYKILNIFLYALQNARINGHRVFLFFKLFSRLRHQVQNSNFSFLKCRDGGQIDVWGGGTCEYTLCLIYIQTYMTCIRVNSIV